MCVICCYCSAAIPFHSQVKQLKDHAIVTFAYAISRPKQRLSASLFLFSLFHSTYFICICLSAAASSISSESSPVSSPATNHSSPVSTPKRGPLGPGPVLVPSAGHSVPNTPPVVTIAPTKTSNGLWRNDGRQVKLHSNTPHTDLELDLYLSVFFSFFFFWLLFLKSLIVLVYFLS